MKVECRCYFSNMLSRVFCGFSDADYGGTEFIFAFTEHFSTSIENMFFTITNKNPFSVEINASTPGINVGGVSQQSTIDAYGVIKIGVNSREVELNGSNIERKSIKVTSTANVLVTVFNRKRFSNEGYRVIPVHNIGTKYTAVTHCESGDLCQIGVMANKDKINVQFKIPDTRYNVTVSYGGINYNNGDFIYVTLNQYETIQIQSIQDLTGVSVTSNFPVTATSGATRTRFNNGNFEHFVEALIPNEHLGKQHIIIASRSSSIKDTVKIVAIYDHTNFTVSGTDFCEKFIIIKKGDKMVYNMTTNYIYIYSNYPIVVAHFTIDIASNGAMYFSTPIEKISSEYFFNTLVDQFLNYKYFTYVNYMTVIVPKGTADGMLLDETKLAANTSWMDINGTHFMAATIQLTNQASHRLRHQNSIKIGGYIYGQGEAENYAFPLGYVFDTNYTVSTETFSYFIQ